MEKKAIHRSRRDPLTKRLIQRETESSIKKNKIKTRPYLYKYLISNSECSCVCGKKFSEKAILREHLGACKTADVVRFCRFCKILYPNLNALVVHRVQTHGPAPCADCGKRFINARILAKHRERWHTVLECLLCGKKCKVKNFGRHLRCHTVPFSCSRCRLKFSSGSYLKEHMRSVHGGLRFWCKECGKCYTHRAGLGKHILEKHKNKKYYCSYCSVGYTRKSFMMKHVLRVHGEVSTRPKVSGA